jgi:ABC-2 type transport system ATP-binding protein
LLCRCTYQLNLEDGETTMTNMIEVSNVSKTFGNQTVLHNVNFQVKAGEIIGLLGPNGAGKTTLIRILNGVIKSDGGTISIN